MKTRFRTALVCSFAAGTLAVLAQPNAGTNSAATTLGPAANAGAAPVASGGNGSIPSGNGSTSGLGVGTGANANNSTGSNASLGAGTAPASQSGQRDNTSMATESANAAGASVNGSAPSNAASPASNATNSAVNGQGAYRTESTGTVDSLSNHINTVGTPNNPATNAGVSSNANSNANGDNGTQQNSGQTYRDVDAPPLNLPPDTPGVAPGSNYRWVPGGYTRRDNRWQWMAGRWEVPPQSGAAWIPGHYDPASRTWVEGRWVGGDQTPMPKNSSRPSASSNR